MTLKRVWIASPNYSSRGGSGVRLVIVHTAEGALTYEALGNFFKSSSAGVSSHTGIDDKLGKCGEYVKRGNKAWTAGNANPYSVNVELCGFASWSPAEWDRHPNMLSNCAQWIREECKHYGIPIKKLNASQAQGGQKGVCGHVDVSGPGGHWDPGPNFPWSRVLNEAAGGSPPAQSEDTFFPSLPIAAVAAMEDDDMSVEYFVHTTHKDAEGSGGYFAVYSNGLVRRVDNVERDEIKRVYKLHNEGELKTIAVDSKDPGSRFQRQDEALRGYYSKR